MNETIKKQKTEWGSVEWIHLPAQNDEQMSVGVITMLPHTHARRHIHYGQEQMLYVLSGSGVYYINDEEFRFRAGDYFVMPADCSHETINGSNEEVKELLVSVPLGGRRVSGGRTDHSFDEVIRSEDVNLIYKAASALSEDLKKVGSVPYTVFDINAKPVLQAGVFPQICLDKCDPVNKTEHCECARAKFGEADVEDKWLSHTCSHGLKTFLCPVGYDGKLMGVVRGGHFFTSEKGAVNEAAGYDVPMTAQIAIHSVLTQIVESIERYIEYLASVEELRSKDSLLDETISQKETLQHDLSEINEQVTNLKINHHFLFNTLNCMSAMALDGDRMDIYRSIIDLSKLFRYTMTTELKMASLAQEVEYLKAYLNLQKLRYKEGLDVVYDIDEKCLTALIPFNFLQPIVENAFIHGFMNYDLKKEVKISIRCTSEKIVIEMFNNGIAPANAEINLIMDSWTSGNGHGLSLIYEKLRKCYGDSFEMDIQADQSHGTIVTVMIPANIKSENEVMENE